VALRHTVEADDAHKIKMNILALWKADREAAEQRSRGDHARLASSEASRYVSC
jgi:hypothetical protein